MAIAKDFILAVCEILASQNLGPDEAIRSILRTGCEHFEWETAAFWELDTSREKLVCAYFYSTQLRERFENATKSIALLKGQGLPGRVWEHNTPMWIPDVMKDTNFPRTEAAREANLNSAFAFPISIGGCFIGLFEFFSPETAAPDNVLLNTFAVLGTELGQLYERQRIQHELAQQAKLNACAAEIGTVVNKMDSLVSILHGCAERIVDGIDDVFAVRVRAQNEKSESLELVAGGCESAASYKRTLPLMLDDKVLGELMVYSQTPLSQVADNALCQVANNIALCIARKQSSYQLAASEKLFREFADNVGEVFFVSAPRLDKHYYVSPAFEQIFGFPVADVYVNPHLWKEAIIPEHRERVGAYVNRMIGTEMPEEEIDYAITTPDGKLKWLSARTFATLDEEDGATYVCGTVRDVSERKESENRVSEFYSMLSHELRTPLTSIKVALHLLEKQQVEGQDDRAHQLIVLARRESDRLIRLVSNLLDIERIELGKLSLYRQDVAAQELVAQTVDVLSSVAAERSITLRAEPIGEDVRVTADKDRIVQVLTNLLSNACKYSPDGSDVIVKIEPDEECVRFCVIDQGPGIHATDQPKLFDLFWRHSPQAATEGAGLGLPICKGIVEAHGGRIGCISAPEKGSIFWFEIARSHPQDGAEHTADQYEQQTAD